LQTIADTTVSQGSVATYLKCGWLSIDCELRAECVNEIRAKISQNVMLFDLARTQ